VRHANDFEPGAINNLGDVAFGSDLTEGISGHFVGEGVFLRSGGQTLALGRAGDPAPSPDTATLGPFFYGELSVNDVGDVPFVFQREPATFVDGSLLFGDNAGLYFFDSNTGAVTPRLLPGVSAPGGGSFHGFSFRAAINIGGDIVFAGITTPETLGPGFALNGGQGLGQGIYLMNSAGSVSKVVRPGDPAPGRKTFDFAQIPWINAGGAVVFGAHVTEEPCIQFVASNIPGTQLFCADSVYARDAGPGQIRSIAHIGDPAPGGGTFQYAYAAKVNNSGQIVFLGALAAHPKGTGHLPLDSNSGVFLHSGDKNIALVRPGDALPGGGRLATAGFFTIDVWINNAGVVSFSAQLDTSTGGVPDTGLYTWSSGTLTLVARSGTVIPGVGTIQALQPPVAVGAPYPVSGAAINDRGQIVFQATLTAGRGVILLATPTQ